MTRKSGRAISAATRAKLEEAIAHHKAATQCLEEVLAQDDDDAAKALAHGWGVAEGRLFS